MHSPKLKRRSFSAKGAVFPSKMLHHNVHLKKQWKSPLAEAYLWNSCWGSALLPYFWLGKVFALRWVKVSNVWIKLQWIILASCYSNLLSMIIWDMKTMNHVIANLGARQWNKCHSLIYCWCTRRLCFTLLLNKWKITRKQQFTKLTPKNKNTPIICNTGVKKRASSTIRYDT